MALFVDAQLREETAYASAAFPVGYYENELTELPNRAGPLHWHPDFEILTALIGPLDYQVGQQHITLTAGDSIFVNANLLHAIRQLDGEQTDPMPNIVFSGTLLAQEDTDIYQKYVRPILRCDELPYIVFRQGNPANDLILDTYAQCRARGPCFEMRVQRNISSLFEMIYCNLDSYPRHTVTRIQIKNQVRMQKMLAYLYAHYAEPVTLADIAGAAHISRSEAGRCFTAYMGCSPVEALIRYRLQIAHGMLQDKSKSLQEISEACGFSSANYLSRQFRRVYGYAPGSNR